MKPIRSMRRMHPATLILSSFLFLIGIGTILLLLPFSTTAGTISPVDALFTATSAVCVTGLIVVDTGSSFTGIGQGIILVLIQLGGIGIMTLSVSLYRWMRRSVSFRHRKVMQDLLAHTPREDIFKVVFSVVKFTLTIEFLGFILLALFWSRTMPFARALYVGLFHAVSAFCNAGFSLFSDSMMGYRGSIAVNAVISLLIVVGGLGFPVLYELEQLIIGRGTGRISVQTKTVLTTSAILIAAGAAVFGLLEFSSTGEPLPLRSKILASIFQSITARTAGFNTVDIAGLSDAGIALMIFLMFIGASPGSCGGGVKTTSLAVLAASSFSRMRGFRRVSIGRKSIPEETVVKSLILTVLAMVTIGVVFFLLLATNGHGEHGALTERGSFVPYLFETVSAFGTVGLSMGITSSLNGWGRILITLMMIIGRVGILTFSYILTSTAVIKGVEYSEENIMIG